jgi:hypothetical protein
MEVDEYLRVATERGSLQKAEKHLDQRETCKHLKALVRGTILRGRVQDMLNMDQIAHLLQQVQFRKR